MNEFYRTANKQVDSILKSEQFIELITKESALEDLNENPESFNNITSVLELKDETEVLLSEIPRLPSIEFKGSYLKNDEVIQSFGTFDYGTNPKEIITDPEKFKLLKSASIETSSIDTICMNKSEDLTWVHSKADNSVILKDQFHCHFVLLRSHP